MNEPKNFEEFRKKQLDNERTFDLHTAMLQELSTKQDAHTKMLTALQVDVSDIKSAMATKDDIARLEGLIKQLLERGK